MQIRLLIGALLFFVLYIGSVVSLTALPRASLVEEMRVAPPRFVQVLMAGGDRYLAANIANWRALVAVTETMQSDNFAVQGRLQQDVAWFNPAHEDNYYVAAAILPWNGQLPAAQDVLLRAGKARTYDWNPYFYYGFNIYFFDRNPALAAEWLRKAARQSRLEDDAYVLETIAANWYQSGYRPGTAAKYIDAMAANARSSGFRRFLERRAARLATLDTLRDAAVAFRAARGRSIANFAELVEGGFLAALPPDLAGFEIAPDGIPDFRNRVTKR